MKIMIIGKSGSGKSTLAKLISDRYNLPLLYLDKVQWLPGWKSRTNVEKEEILNNFLNNNNSWVIDGNYTKCIFERRLNEADQIIYLDFDRFSCLYRCFKRYLQNKNKTRESITEGCNEKIDLEFIIWILFKGRTKEIKERNEWIQEEYKDKVIYIKNQRQLDKYIQSIK